MGLGYIGLPTAVVLADHGFDVLGVDSNESVVDSINRGQAHIVEPDLDAALARAHKKGRIRASNTPEPADYFLIAVPTPFKEGHRPDVTYVEQASYAIASSLCPGNLIIIESTSPVGTTEHVRDLVSDLRTDLSFQSEGDPSKNVHLAYCPERVLPGQILKELVENDRVVGGLSPSCAEKARAFYQGFVRGHIYMTEAKTAELVKLTENASRDVNIAFANEMSLICDRFGIDPYEMIDLANHHPRVNILQPGPGVGGHCVAVDPWFIVDAAPDLARLIHLARDVNDSKPDYVVKKVKAAIESYPQSKVTVACLGLAFKANVDDLRESPAMEIARKVSAMAVEQCLLVEPNIENIPPDFKNQSTTNLATLKEAVEKADIFVLLVDHKSFLELDPQEFGDRPVIDTRGMLRRMWRGSRLKLKGA